MREKVWHKTAQSVTAVFINGGDISLWTMHSEVGDRFISRFSFFLGKAYVTDVMFHFSAFIWLPLMTKHRRLGCAFECNRLAYISEVPGHCEIAGNWTLVEGAFADVLLHRCSLNACFQLVGHLGSGAWGCCSRSCRLSRVWISF